MAKVYSPNKGYTGLSATVSFVAGVGETNDPRLLSWFAGKGYRIERAEQAEVDPLESMTVDELKAYAEEKSIPIGNATSANGILKKIREAKGQ